MKPSSCFMKSSSIFFFFLPWHISIYQVYWRAELEQQTSVRWSLMFVENKQTLNIHTNMDTHSNVVKYTNTRICAYTDVETHTSWRIGTHIEHRRQKAMENLTRRTNHNPWSRSFDSLTAHAAFGVAEEAYGICLLPSTLFLLLE